MSVNSIEDFATGLRNLPSADPPQNMLEQVRESVRKRKAAKQQFMQFGGVSCVALAVFGIVIWNQPALDEPVISIDQPTLVVQDTRPDDLVNLERALFDQYSPATIAQSAIIVRMADVNTELSSLGSDDTSRRNELLQRKEALKRSYRLVRHQTNNQSDAVNDGYL
ncbi:MAG: hypothetical protein OXG24_02740 [Gammaproteobacteria bacterium]|nr:hypothetical protein [Gammaproteobacteria bacterium]